MRDGRRRGDRRSSSARRPSAREVERAVNQIEASFYHRMERVGGFGGKADQLNAYYRGGRPGLFQRGPGAIPVARRRRHPVRRAPVSARRRPGSSERRPDRKDKPCGAGSRGRGEVTMKPSRKTAALFLLCLAAALAAPAQAPDRSKPPAPGPPPALKLPAIQKLKLSNGIPVLFIELHKVPLVQVAVLLRAGAAADPKGKAGLASLTASMLDRGAGKRSALEISDAVDYLGADLRPGRAGTRRPSASAFPPSGSERLSRSWPTSSCVRLFRRRSWRGSARSC